MNITLSGTKVSMDGHTLAFQKNNLVDSMAITVDTDETWQYKLDVKYPCKDSNGKELYNVIDLTRVGNTCTAILQATMLPFNGKYTMQLRGISGNKVYHTDTFDVWVKYSIDPGKVYDPVPSEFYQIEQAATEQAANAKQSASNAAESARQSAESATNAAASATKAENAVGHSPIIGENGNWFVWDFTKSEYVDTGKPASTPPITHETAGKYLTNDGSKTEWAKIESNLFLVHLIQGEPDSDGIPTYTVDKTFTEIKTAYDSGKKVELIPPVDDSSFPVSVGSSPFEVAVVSPEGIEFRSIGTSIVGISLIPSWELGGIPLGIVSVIISPDEKVSVEFPFSVDGDTGIPVWNMIQKLPQQYVVRVIDEMDGTLSANNTLAQLNSVTQAYSFLTDLDGESSINAVYNGKLYYMSAKTPTSITFTTTTENGLETLTVSNDGKEGSEDVWTHEVATLGGGSDLSLGITGAQVGQIAKITAVDTDGKPTEWEAVDGVDIWEIIADYTAAEAASWLNINKDANGNAFSLRKVKVEIVLPNAVDGGTWYLYLSPGSDFFGVVSISATGSGIVKIQCEAESDDIVTFANKKDKNYSNELISLERSADYTTITAVRLGNWNNLTFPAGTKVLVKGVRA